VAGGKSRRDVLEPYLGLFACEGGAFSILRAVLYKRGILRRERKLDYGGGGGEKKEKLAVLFKKKSEVGILYPRFYARTPTGEGNTEGK